MIKIKIELWPGGRPTGMKELGEITIANIEQVNQREYQYDVVLRDYATMETGHAAIFHTRSESVWILLRKALQALVEEGELPLAWRPGSKAS